MLTRFDTPSVSRQFVEMLLFHWAIMNAENY